MTTISLADTTGRFDAPTSSKKSKDGSDSTASFEDVMNSVGEEKIATQETSQDAPDVADNVEGVVSEEPLTSEQRIIALPNIVVIEATKSENAIVKSVNETVKSVNANVKSENEPVETAISEPTPIETFEIVENVSETETNLPNELVAIDASEKDTNEIADTTVKTALTLPKLETVEQLETLPKLETGEKLKTGEKLETVDVTALNDVPETLELDTLPDDVEPIAALQTIARPTESAVTSELKSTTAPAPVQLQPAGAKALPKAAPNNTPKTEQVVNTVLDVPTPEGPDFAAVVADLETSVQPIVLDVDVQPSTQFSPQMAQSVQQPQVQAQQPVQVAQTPEPAIIPTTDPVWAEKFVEHIKQTFSEGMPALDIQLTPENLGQVNIRLDIKGDVANVLVVTETADAQKLFNDNQSRLAELFARSGMELGQHSANTSSQNQQNGSGSAQEVGGSEDGDGTAQTSISKPKTSESLVDLVA